MQVVIKLQTESGKTTVTFVDGHFGFIEHKGLNIADPGVSCDLQITWPMAVQ